MLNKKSAGRCFSLGAETDGHFAPVLQIAMPRKKSIALQPIEKARNRRPCDTGAICEFVRRKTLWLPMEEKKHDEFAFRKVVRRKAHRTVAINRGGEGKKLET